MQLAYLRNVGDQQENSRSNRIYTNLSVKTAKSNLTNENPTDRLVCLVLDTACSATLLLHKARKDDVKGYT